MKNDFQRRAELAVLLTSRRKFIGAAVAIGGAGMLSAELPDSTDRRESLDSAAGAL